MGNWGKDEGFVDGSNDQSELAILLWGRHRKPWPQLVVGVLMSTDEQVLRGLELETELLLGIITIGLKSFGCWHKDPRLYVLIAFQYILSLVLEAMLLVKPMQGKGLFVGIILDKDIVQGLDKSLKFIDIGAVLASFDKKLRDFGLRAYLDIS